MAVNVCLPLFGSPVQELEEGANLRGQRLRELGEALNERLRQAADTLDRLAAAGWTAQLALYEVLVTRPDVQTREAALHRLQEAGVDPLAFMIVEEIDEEDVE